MEFLKLIIGFIVLIKAADYFVDSSVSLAKIFKMPEIIIGATIVSIGTTLPETMVSAISAFKGHSDISYGNAIGSIICNTALISGIAILFSPSKVDRKSVKIPSLFFLVSFLIYACFAYFAGGFSRQSGITLLSIFVIYILFLVFDNASNNNLQKNSSDIESTESNLVEDRSAKNKSFLIIQSLATIILSAIFIAFASNLLIDSATSIAKKLNIAESVIGITIVAFGTSLPEFTTAITSIIKGHSNISFGNIIGANLLNLLLVSGLAITIRPFDLPSERIIYGIKSSLVVDLPIAIISMAIMCLPTIVKGETKRWQGALLLLIYVFFLFYQM